MKLGLAVRHIESTSTIWLWGRTLLHSATLFSSPNDLFRTTSNRCGDVEASLAFQEQRQNQRR
jgi:hypothetical protein